MKPFTEIVFLASNRGEKLLGILKNTQWDTAYYPFPHSRQGQISLFWGLCRRALRNRPVILITDFFGAFPLALFLICRLFSCATIVRLRGNAWIEQEDQYRDDSSWLQQIRKRQRIWLATQLVREADLVLPVSRALGDEMLEQVAVPVSKIKALPIYIDADSGSMKARAQLAAPSLPFLCNEDTKLIITVTSFRFWEKARGILDFIEAFNTLSSRDPAVHWVIVGDGQYRDTIQTQVTEHAKHADNIHFTGLVKDTAQWYGVGDMLVYFSYTDGLPNVLLEAGVYRLPILVNDFPPLTEVIQHNDNGLVVNARETDMVVRAVEACLYDQALACRLGEKAYDTVTRKYSAEAVGARFESIIQEFQA